MNPLEHFRRDGVFSSLGLYAESLARQLPDDVRSLCALIRHQIVHRVTLPRLEVATAEQLSQGATDRLPWFRQPEDAVLCTATAIVAELFRRDSRGLTYDRSMRDKLVLTCRPVALLTSAVLKAKGNAARVRAGFAGYIPGYEARFVDHWITQYWSDAEARWISVDVDASTIDTGFDQFDMPEGRFVYAADAWRTLRADPDRADDYWNPKPVVGGIAVAWQLFHDFHCLMNSESIYPHHPRMVLEDSFASLRPAELDGIDHLASLMRDPDRNLDELARLWDHVPEYRLLDGVLLYGWHPVDKA